MFVSSWKRRKLHHLVGNLNSAVELHSKNCEVGKATTAATCLSSELEGRCGWGKECVEVYWKERLGSHKELDYLKDGHTSY